jgi:hypothetical protein
LRGRYYGFFLFSFFFFFFFFFFFLFFFFFFFYCFFFFYFFFIFFSFFFIVSFFFFFFFFLFFFFFFLFGRGHARPELSTTGRLTGRSSRPKTPAPPGLRRRRPRSGHPRGRPDARSSHNWDEPEQAVQARQAVPLLAMHRRLEALRAPTFVRGPRPAPPIIGERAHCGAGARAISGPTPDSGQAKPRSCCYFAGVAGAWEPAADEPIVQAARVIPLPPNPELLLLSRSTPGRGERAAAHRRDRVAGISDEQRIDLRASRPLPRPFTVSSAVRAPYVSMR